MADEESNFRQIHWFSLAAASTVALVALLKDIDNDISDEKKAVVWAVSAICISLIFSGLAVFANLLLRDKFVGTAMEGSLAFITFGFWCASLPAIMDPGNDIATTTFGGINNNNLFFFSWGGFFASFFVLMSYTKQARGEGSTVTLSDFTISTWAGFAATSFIAMAAAIRLYKELDCDEDQSIDLLDDVCDRTTFALSLGLVTGIIAALWASVVHCVSGGFWMTTLDAVLAWLVLAAWCVGITLITFDDEAPARQLGNLYFFSWGSFSLSVILAMSGLKKVMGMMMGDAEEPTPREEKHDEKMEDEGDVEEDVKGEHEEAEQEEPSTSG